MTTKKTTKPILLEAASIKKGSPGNLSPDEKDAWVWGESSRGFLCLSEVAKLVAIPDTVKNVQIEAWSGPMPESYPVTSISFDTVKIGNIYILENTPTMIFGEDLGITAGRGLPFHVYSDFAEWVENLEKKNGRKPVHLRVVYE